jgi:hypothetical protein
MDLEPTGTNVDSNDEFQEIRSLTIKFWRTLTSKATLEQERKPTFLGKRSEWGKEHIYKTMESPSAKNF